MMHKLTLAIVLLVSLHTLDVSIKLVDKSIGQIVGSKLHVLHQSICWLGSRLT